MKYNIGFADSVVRVMFAIFVVLLTIFGFISGAVAVILNLIGIIFFVTAMFGVCLIYKIFGLSTRPSES